MNNNPSRTPVTTQISRPGKCPARIAIDAGRLESLARELPSQRAVAGALGVSAPTLCNRLLDTPELREAWERGRAAREGAKPSPLALGKSLRPSPPPEPRRALRKPEPLFTGTPSQRVLASLGQDDRGRTFGQLMHETGLDWHPLVECVNRLTVGKKVVARDVCGSRVHFLVGTAEVSR
jgi:hypothetical protein